MYDGQVVATSITFLTTHVYTFDTDSMCIVCKYDVLLKSVQKESFNEKKLFQVRKAILFYKCYVCYEML